MRPLARGLVVMAVVVAGAGWYLQRDGVGPQGPGENLAPAPLAAAPVAAAPAANAPQGGARDDARTAFEQRARGRMLLTEGRVERILADDREGSPHQRFIIATNSGQTLLVAHNLDLAPRLDGLAVGDVVSVFGEYEWSAQGGVLHWTHDDPRGDHVTGHIDWRGRRYQ